MTMNNLSVICVSFCRHTTNKNAQKRAFVKNTGICFLKKIKNITYQK